MATGNCQNNKKEKWQQIMWKKVISFCITEKSILIFPLVITTKQLKFYFKCSQVIKENMCKNCSQEKKFIGNWRQKPNQQVNLNKFVLKNI